jgi:mRNA-degrading endonuclease RelE of RelBE toxin-antitoxin system
VPEVCLTRNAEKDLRRIGPGVQRKRIAAALTALGADMTNLDVKPIVIAKPWRRLRVGDYRVLYRQRPGDVYEVDRIVHRSDLDASAAGLPTD